MKELTISETAQMLGLTRQYVWLLIKTNKIRARKIGRFYVVPFKEIERFNSKRNQTHE